MTIPAGPWRYWPALGTVYETADGAVYEAIDRPVAIIAGNQMSLADPDARMVGNLIAAAPKLFAALDACRIALKNRDQSPHEAKCLEAAKYAIAKAEGRAP